MQVCGSSRRVRSRSSSPISRGRRVCCTSSARRLTATHSWSIAGSCAPAFASGYEVDEEGDAFFYAFPTVASAVAAVEQAMHALDGGPIRIRVGIHTGEPVLDPPKYVGPGPLISSTYADETPMPVGGTLICRGSGVIPELSVRLSLVEASDSWRRLGRRRLARFRMSLLLTIQCCVAAAVPRPSSVT